MDNTISSNLSSLASMFSGANSKKGGALSSLDSAKSLSNASDAIKDAASKLSGKGMLESYQMQFMQASFEQSGSNFNLQIGLASFAGSKSASGSNFAASMTMINISGSFANNGSTSANLADIFGMIDTNAIGYKGKPLSTLSQSEAAALVSDEGFFGMENTAKRVADFVLAGAGDDLAKLKAGKEGVIRGYNEAQQLWGGKLPQISQKTQEKLLEIIDQRINELGGNVVSVEA